MDVSQARQTRGWPGGTDRDPTKLTRFARDPDTGCDPSPAPDADADTGTNTDADTAPDPITRCQSRRQREAQNWDLQGALT